MNDRFLTSKGYTEALKKELGTSDIRKVKNFLKEAGLKNDRLSTFKKIKEKDFLKDLKKAEDAGVIKNFERAKIRFKREQVRENRNLTFKEGRSANVLCKKTKDRLVAQKDTLSPGARLAIERHESRNRIIRKTGGVGIDGFQTMEKQGDSTLWERYKALKGLRYKNKLANQKFKEISSEINLIRLKAKKDPKVLRNYGIPEMQKDKSAWKPKTLPGREGARAQNNKNKEAQGGKSDEGDSSSKKLSQGSVDISHSSGSALPAVSGGATKKEAPVMPFSIVKGFENFPKEANVLDDEVEAKNVIFDRDLKEKVARSDPEQAQQFGFIDEDGGDVKLDSENEDTRDEDIKFKPANEEVGVDEEYKKAA